MLLHKSGHSGNADGMVGMNVDVLHIASTLHHIFQYIQACFPSGKIIVQADEIDIFEDADQQSTLFICPTAVIWSLLRHRATVIQNDFHKSSRSFLLVCSYPYNITSPVECIEINKAFLKL